MTGPSSRLPRVLLWIVCVPILFFLIAPLGIVIPVSFSSASYLQFPPPGWSTRWYQSYFLDPSWIDATLLSVRVGLTVVVMSIVFGLLASIAMTRYRLPWSGFLRVVLMTPLIVPSVVVAIAVYSQYVDLQLVGSFWGIVLAHTVLALPFAILLLSSGLQQLPEGLEEASYMLGASRIATFFRVVLPSLAPSIASAAIFAFITSWDEIIMVLFIGGAEGTTLPLKMFSYLRTEINPTIASVSTLLIGLVVIGVIASSAVSSIRARRASRRQLQLESN